MTKTELNEKLKLLQVECQKKKIALFVEYATSNNPIAVGDIITGHNCKGQVIKMQAALSPFEESSEMRYWCKILKKDGTPRKDGAESWMYQSNVKEINGMPYDSSRTN